MNLTLGKTKERRMANSKRTWKRILDFFRDRSTKIIVFYHCSFSSSHYSFFFFPRKYSCLPFHTHPPPHTYTPRSNSAIIALSNITVRFTLEYFPSHWELLVVVLFKSLQLGAFFFFSSVYFKLNTLYQHLEKNNILIILSGVVSLLASFLQIFLRSLKDDVIFHM